MENITIKNLIKKETVLVLGKIFFPGIVFLLLTIIFSFKANIYFGLLSRDVNGIHNAPPYIGMLSNIGIFFWSLTVAILFFSYRLSVVCDANKSQSRFLFFSGSLSLLMLIDDLFQMHEFIFPVYLHFPEMLFYVFYFSSVLLILYLYYSLILNSDYILFLIAFLFFALSGFFSEIESFGLKVPQPHIFEDGTKFLGIISWFSYFTRTSYTYTLHLLLKQNLNEKVL